MKKHPSTHEKHPPRRVNGVLFLNLFKLRFKCHVSKNKKSRPDTVNTDLPINLEQNTKLIKIQFVLCGSGKDQQQNFKATWTKYLFLPYSVRVKTESY